MDESKQWTFAASFGISAVIFGVGFISGTLFRRFFPGKNSPPLDSFARATRIASLRARGLGRNHKMVFVVRNDLNMGKGKMAAQCSHAAVMCYQKALYLDPVNLELWEATGCAKIALKADGDDQSLKLLERKAKDLKLVAAIVRDAGHTQVPSGTCTVLGIGPAPVTEIDQITGHLKLL